MFIDTHCHLTDEYDGGVDAVITRAQDAGVGAKSADEFPSREYIGA